MMDADQLCQEVINFRDALETEEVKQAYLIFNDFPSGACRDASILLGVYLEEKGFGQFAYTLSENEHGKTHSWLENDLLIIDITADQFAGIEEKVIIKDKDSSGDHLGFTVSRRHVASLEALVGPMFYNAIRAYDLIKRG